MAVQLADHPPLLQLVHLDHGVQELEVVAGVGRQLLQRERVLRKAGAAEADPRAQEARADPAVEADALRDLHDVGAGRLADVRDLVDERDPRHQRGVRRELDHLGRRDVAADDRRLDAAVQRRDGVAVLVLERADHDPVGVEEVLDRRALGGELGIRDVARPVRGRARRAGGAPCSPVPTGTVLFITTTQRRSICGSSSITVQTAERSASPEYVGGVPTAT